MFCLCLVGHLVFKDLSYKIGCYFIFLCLYRDLVVYGLLVFKDYTLIIVVRSKTIIKYIYKFTSLQIEDF